MGGVLSVGADRWSARFTATADYRTRRALRWRHTPAAAPRSAALPRWHAVAPRCRAPAPRCPRRAAGAAHGQALCGQRVFATLGEQFTECFPRRCTGARGDGLVQERIGGLPLLLGQGHAALRQPQRGRAVMHVAPASEVGLAGGQALGRQAAIQRHQFVIPALVQGLFQRQQRRLVPVQRHGAAGIRAHHVRGRAQRLRRGFHCAASALTSAASSSACAASRASSSLLASAGSTLLWRSAPSWPYASWARPACASASVRSHRPRGGSGWIAATSSALIASTGRSRASSCSARSSLQGGVTFAQAL